MSLSIILILIKKEFTLELRRKSVISGIILYLVSLTFICYMTFTLRSNVISPATWSALFWLAMLFSVINSVAKSFMGDSRGLSIYLYSIARPHQVIAAKIIYNTILCILLSGLGYVLFTLFIGNPIQDNTLFFGTLALTSWGFAASLSLISGIASRASNSNVLMAVLSFPVVISILLLATKVTKSALDGVDRSLSMDELMNLFAINCILTALAYVLFPYIWRS